MSHFSAVILLKKSLVKVKSGSPCLPTMSYSDAGVNSANQEELDILGRKHDELMMKYDDTMKTIKTQSNDVDACDDVDQNFIQGKKAAASSANILKNTVN